MLIQLLKDTALFVWEMACLALLLGAIGLLALGLGA